MVETKNATDTKNVSTGKPMLGGAVKRAAVGTALPTNTTAALNAAFESLGYISEDGVTNSLSMESTNIKAWGGQTVYSAITESGDVFKMTFIESSNATVLKTIFGEDNVTIDATAKEIAVKVKLEDTEPYSWVIDTLLAKGKKRTVIPSAKVTSIGDVVYKDNELISYEVELTAVADDTGNYHYEYTKLEG